MTDLEFKWFKMDTGDVETKTYDKHWIDVIPETSTLSFDTRELTLDQFILHLLVESDKVAGINAGTNYRVSAIDRLQASINMREEEAAQKVKVRELSEKLKRAHEYTESPLSSKGEYWEKLATEFLKL